MSPPNSCDFLVIGSGIAALSFALEASRFGEVVIVTKRARDECNTRYAQGGIAAVLGEGDTFDAHIQDTMTAGAGLCHQVVVEICVREGPERIAQLQEIGVRFTQTSDPGAAHPAEGNELDLTLEAAHSHRRVAHAGDITGREVERALLEAVGAKPNVTLYEDHMAVDLITLSKFGGPDRCAGAYVLDERAGTVKTFLARATIMASGGAGKVYLYTTNPDVATGDGIAMAYRAGAEIANMEFYQFHPTCLFHPQAKSFLVSEALRGEGGVLRLLDGTAFMERHDKRRDLAPRDIVARAIDIEMKRTGSEHVLLDMTHKDASFLRARFPNIYAECLKWGIDITTQPIPVVPAAHYLCGGITTDLHGRTTLPGLWAIGECACTGLHGANRLASNSLLEGLVFGHRAAKKLEPMIAELRTEPSPSVPDWVVGNANPSDEAVVVTQNWDELRRLMWNYVGIVRTNKRLERARRRIAVLQEEIREYYWEHLVTRDLLELRNIATVAELVVASAMNRRESRGLHATNDYPETLPTWAEDTVLKRGVPAHLRGR
jgi:L-aspartate oxidase